MQVKLTMGERLKDLRTAQKLTLEQLAAEVGISKSALGKYESDNGKDISPYSILVLADYYGVSCDYLMGRTETKNHPNTALHELHLSDASIDVLRTGKFNHRLLSELICHKDFQRFMLDAEIYVDRIADMRVNDMNAVLEAVRQMALMKSGGNENDLHLRTLEVAQIREDEYFGSLIADDLKGILRDIREQHRPDTMTAATTRKGQKETQIRKNRHLLFKAGADFCYPIMRLNFWRKFGVNPLLHTQKIKQFQGFAVSINTCRPCRLHWLRQLLRRRLRDRACRPRWTQSSGRRRRWTLRSQARCG